MRGRYALSMLVSAVLLLAAFPALAGSRPEFPEIAYDAGRVGEAPEFAHDFVVRNTGDAPFRITEVRPSCGCTVVEHDREIPPGGEGKIRAKVRLAGLPTGRASKTIVVLTDSAALDRIVLQVRFEHVPPIEFLIRGRSQTVYMLASRGEEKTDKILVRPHLAGMKIKGVRCSNPALDVRIEPAKASGKTAEGPAAMLLPREGDVWVALTLRPDAPLGPQRAEIIVETTHPTYSAAKFIVEAMVKEPQQPASS